MKKGLLLIHNEQYYEMILYINALSITKRALFLIYSLFTFRREATYTTDYFVRPPVRMYVRQKLITMDQKKVGRE